jgi:hypothetical protein
MHEDDVISANDVIYEAPSLCMKMTSYMQMMSFIQGPSVWVKMMSFIKMMSFSTYGGFASGFILHNCSFLNRVLLHSVFLRFSIDKHGISAKSIK